MSLISQATLFSLISLFCFIGKYYNLNSASEKRPQFEKTLLCAMFNNLGVMFAVVAALIGYNAEYGNTIHCIVGSSDSTIVDTQPEPIPPAAVRRRAFSDKQRNPT